MKVLGNLNVCGNQIQGVGGIFDTNGNPIGQNQAPTGMAFKVYEGEFDSSDTFTQDNTENDVYYCIMVINNYVHGLTKKTTLVSNSLLMKITMLQSGQIAPNITSIVLWVLTLQVWIAEAAVEAAVAIKI